MDHHRLKAVLLLGAVLAPPGCNVALPLSGSRSADASDADAPAWADAATDALAHADVATDVDAATDATGRADVPPDLSPPLDGAGAPDMKGDGASGPCAPAALLQVYLTPTVALCKAPAPVSQCDGALSCNGVAGWSLCPASVYRARVTVSPPAGAWISGCIRQTGELPHAPTDLPCPCLGTYGSDVDISWSCQSSGPFHTSSGENLGLVTDPACYQVGEMSTATEGYWDPEQAQLLKKMVACCQ